MHKCLFQIQQIFLLALHVQNQQNANLRQIGPGCPVSREKVVIAVPPALTTVTSIMQT